MIDNDRIWYYIIRQFFKGDSGGWHHRNYWLVSAEFTQELLGEVIYPLNEPIEVIGYGYKEFKNSPYRSFLSEIISKGKTIYQE